MSGLQVCDVVSNFRITTGRRHVVAEGDRIAEGDGVGSVVPSGVVDDRGVGSEPFAHAVTSTRAASTPTAALMMTLTIEAELRYGSCRVVGGMADRTARQVAELQDSTWAAEVPSAEVVRHAEEAVRDAMLHGTPVSARRRSRS